MKTSLQRSWKGASLKDFTHFQKRRKSYSGKKKGKDLGACNTLLGSEGPAKRGKGVFSLLRSIFLLSLEKKKKNITLGRGEKGREQPAHLGKRGKSQKRIAGGYKRGSDGSPEEDRSTLGEKGA